MPNVKVIIHRLTARAKLPMRHTEGSAGYDLYVTEDATIPNINVLSEAIQLHTGISMEIPAGYHAEIYPRSSIGAHTKLRFANSVGIIDSDYRGEIMIIAENNSRTPVRVVAGQRIAQILIVKDTDVNFIWSEEKPSYTKRGKGGIGSTGK